MELIDGGDLTQIISAAYPLPEDVIAAVMYATLSALEHLHEKEIIHRDIKSDNIMIGMDGNVKLSE